MEEAYISHWEPVGNNDLAIFRIARADGQSFWDFKAGQYAQLAFWDQPEYDARPRQFSIASTPSNNSELEFYAVLVRDGGEDGKSLGSFTGTLWNHQAIGSKILVMGPAGRFDLTRTDLKQVVCVATGTGLAPFVSMVREQHELYKKTKAFDRHITIIHGVSYSNELGYRDELESLSADSNFEFTYIPTVSRPDQDADYNNSISCGRANDLVRLLLNESHSGRTKPVPAKSIDNALVGLDTPQQAAYYLCGNPDMIADISSVLEARGYQIKGRGAQVIKEDYW